MRYTRLTALFAAFFLLTAPCVTHAADTIFDETTSQTLIKGLTYWRIQRLTTGGWQDIHIVEADMNEPHLKLELLTNGKGVSHMTNVLQLAEDSGALAAVNADFFARKSGTSNRGSAVGIEVKDGELLSTPATETGMNALYQLKDGSIGFNLFDFSVTVTAPNGDTEPIRHINKYDDLTGIVMYTRAWNNLTLDPTYNLEHMIVENDVVKDICAGDPPAEIPENGYVLTYLKDYNMFLPDHFSVGDPIKLDITTRPNFREIETAVGGGAYLLIDGKVPQKFSHNIGGYNPRTAIGVDQTGKKIYLAAVDGRQAMAKGMTQTEMGYLMAEIGCWTALNLDGGGSTTMAVKPQGEAHQVVNSPSDGSLRNVANGIGFTADVSGAVLSAVRMRADDTRVFNGTSRWVWLEGLDQFGQSIEIPQDEVSWSSEGVEGTFRDGCYYPAGTGTATLTGRYGGYEDTLSLEVLDKPYSMQFSFVEKRLSAGESAVLYLNAKDQNGYGAVVYPRDTTITIENGIGQMEGNRVTAVRAGSALVTANLDEVSANLVLYVDSDATIAVPEGVRLADPKNRHSDINGEPNSFQFTVFGRSHDYQTFYEKLVMLRAQQEMEKYGEKHAFIGNSISDFMLAPFDGDYFTAQNYNCFTHKGSTFITVNNHSGDLFGSDPGQWQRLFRDVEGVDGNLFVFMDNEGISSNPLEKAHFKRLMEQIAASGGNVMVFGGSWGNQAEVENRVRYITAAGMPDNLRAAGPVGIAHVRYYIVTVNGMDISYELRGLMD